MGKEYIEGIGLIGSSVDVYLLMALSNWKYTFEGVSFNVPLGLYFEVIPVGEGVGSGGDSGGGGGDIPTITPSINN